MKAPFTRMGIKYLRPGKPAQAPYEAAYVTRYRAEQLARNRRITAWVKETGRFARTGRGNHEQAFCVHGTMADLVDDPQDPSDRTPYSCYLGEPAVANDGPVGLAPSPLCAHGCRNGAMMTVRLTASPMRHASPCPLWSLIIRLIWPARRAMRSVFMMRWAAAIKAMSILKGPTIIILSGAIYWTGGQASF